jgi:4'-phosphopantetheinyl transferase
VVGDGERGVLVRWIDPRAHGVFDPVAAVDALTDAERVRFSTIATGPEKRSFLAGRALARATVAELVGVEPAEVRLDSRCDRCGAEHGLPRVALPASATDVRVSISRTTAAIAVAVARGMSVGIDVETVDAARFAGIEDVALGPRERLEFDLLEDGDRLQALAEWWTAKEAILKALGDGLRTDPRSIELSTPDPRFEPSLMSPHERLEGLQLQALELEPGIVGTLAVLLFSGLGGSATG